MLSTSPLVSSCFRPCPLEGGQCVHLARGGSMIGPVGVTLVFVFRRAWPHLGEADVLYGVLYPGHFCGVYHRDMGHCMVYSLRWEPQRGGPAGPSQAPLTSTSHHSSPCQYFELQEQGKGLITQRNVIDGQGSRVCIGRGHSPSAHTFHPLSSTR